MYVCVNMHVYVGVCMYVLRVCAHEYELDLAWHSQTCKTACVFESFYETLYVATLICMWDAVGEIIFKS